MRKHLLIFFVLIMSLTSACQKQDTEVLTAPTFSPTETLLILSTPTEIIRRTPIPEIKISLPHSLFILAENKVWRLPAGNTKYELFSEPDVKVTSFDIWGRDEQFAYSSVDGQVYIVRDGQEPHLYHDLRSETESEFLIEGFSWSPDGTRLAYAVSYTSDDVKRKTGYPSYPSGLWVMDVNTGIPNWLLSNHYYSGELDSTTLRVTHDVLWSPDGNAMIVDSGFLEHKDMLLLEPLVPEAHEANLIDVEGFGDRLNAAWSADGKTYFLSGNGYGAYSTIAEVNRETKEAILLLDGESEKLSFMSSAQALDNGIVFLAMRDEDIPEQFPPYIPHQLFFGSRKNTSFEYALVDPEQICEEGVYEITWSLSSEWGFLVCSYQSPHTFKVISPNLEILDITSLLSEFIDVEIQDAVWGQ
ncbi:MAG: hypothetical protein GY755_14320 [Chloroflexi bacterium]|nr:hypothetical protein [Chloroflexota bacterium]